MARSKTVNVNTGISVDTRDFKGFAKACRNQAPEVYAEMRKGLREAGELVAKDARKSIEPYSTNIPATIKTRVTGSGNVAVVAGKGLDSAGLLEFGNKGRGSTKKTFRHPVFGDTNNWVDQPTHPFLVPALHNNIEAAVGRITEVLDRAVSRVVATSEAEGL